MQLSISNIGWSSKYDEEMYTFLMNNDFKSLEIAPTRIFPDTPYDKLEEAYLFHKMLKVEKSLTISSMQSIWYGITEMIFASNEEREKLINYTKKAINFASAINCPNLVFGCPRNRTIPQDFERDATLSIAYDFFNEVGNYAANHNTCIAIEPNPPIYHTNFINTTKEAFDICKTIDNPGIKVNLDLGTMIYNEESVEILKDNTQYINHVHISEPHLAPIQKRSLHNELIQELHNRKYEKFISIEMSTQEDISIVKNAVLYLRAVKCL